MQEKEYLTLQKLVDSIPQEEALFPPLQVEKMQRTALIPFPGVNEVKPEALDSSQGKAAIHPPPHYPMFETKEDLALLKEWHNYLFALYQKGLKKPEEIDVEVAQFLLQLPPSSSLTPLLQTLSNAEREELFLHIQGIARLGITLHVVTGKVAFHPSRFLALMKALDLLVSSIQTIESEHFAGYTIFQSIFSHALIDPYFDLGPYQREVFMTLDSLRQKGVPVNLETLQISYDRHGSYNDKTDKLITLWHFKGKPTHKQLQKGYDPKPYVEDFEGKFIPKCSFALRELVMLIEAFSMPHELIKFKGKSYASRDEFKDYMENLRQHLFTNSRSLLQTKELLRMSAEKRILPLDITYTNETYENGHRHNEALTFLGAPFSPYYYLGKPVKSGEVRNRLFEGVVTNITTPEADQDGNWGTEVDDDYEDLSYKSPMHGWRQAQLKIHEDKFIFPKTSLEASRDLQKMVSGRKNRATHAFYTFRKHSYLLQHGEYGQDYQRLFHLLLFRDRLFVNECEANPLALSQTLNTIDEMLLLASKSGHFKTWSFLYKLHVDLLL